MKKIFTLFLALGIFTFAGAVEFSKAKTRSLMTAPVRVQKFAVVENHPNNVISAEQADVPLTFDEVEIAWYPSYSAPGAFDYTIYLSNSAGGNYHLPQGSFDIYTENIMDFAGTYSVAAGNLDMTYGGLYVAQGTSYKQINVTDANCTITMDNENKTMTLAGKFSAGKTLGYTYNLTINYADLSYYDAEHTYEPMEPQELDMNMAFGDIDMSMAADSMINLGFATADSAVVVSLFYFHTDEKATEMPNGTFEFSDEDKGTFLAGWFYSKQKMPVYSFALQQTDEGVYPYYIYDGSVTVSGNGNENKVIDVDALSFYGTPIKFKYNFGGAQAIEEIANDVKATKVIRNGQIYIIRDGKTYNVVGAEVR